MGKQALEIFECWSERPSDLQLHLVRIPSAIDTSDFSTEPSGSCTFMSNVDQETEIVSLNLNVCMVMTRPM